MVEDIPYIYNIMNNFNEQDKSQIKKEVYPYMEILFRSYPNIFVVHRLENVEWTHFFLLKPSSALNNSMYRVIEDIKSKWESHNTYGDICILPASEYNLRRTEDLININEYTSKDFPSTVLTTINNRFTDISARLSRGQKNWSFYLAGALSIAIILLLFFPFLSFTHNNASTNDKEIQETPVDTLQNTSERNNNIFAELETLRNDLNNATKELETVNEKIEEKDEQIKLLTKRNDNLASIDGISKNDIKEGMILSSNSTNLTISNVNADERYVIRFNYSASQSSNKKGIIRLDFNLIELEGLGAGRVFIEKNATGDKIVFQIISNGEITVFKD